MARRGKGEGTITKRKDGRWCGAVTLGYTTDGKQKRKWVYGATRREVAAKLAKWHAKAGSGVVEHSTITVGEWLHRFAETRANERKLAESTRQNYAQYMRHLDALSSIELAKLTTAQIVAWLGSDHMQTLGGSVRAHCYQFLKLALQEAMYSELITTNPAERVRAPAATRVRVRVAWSASEVAAFLAVAKHHRLYGLWYLLLATGVRIGEALALHWSDYHPPKLTVRANLTRSRKRSTTKTIASSATLHLDANTIAVLEEHRANMELEGHTGPWMFPGETGAPLHYRNVLRAWRTLVERAGVRYAGPHLTRHTWTTLAFRAGLNAGQVAARLRHSDPALSMRVYQQLQESDHVAAALSLDNLLQLEAPKTGQIGAPAGGEPQPDNATSTENTAPAKAGQK